MRGRKYVQADQAAGEAGPHPVTDGLGKVGFAEQDYQHWLEHGYVITRLLDDRQLEAALEVAYHHGAGNSTQSSTSTSSP